MSIKINGKTIAVKTPFDSAVVDLVSGLNKQKQVLAQALNDKGVNVTSTDTLDKMAGAVKNLEVVGEKTNLKGTVLYSSAESASNMFGNINYEVLAPLPLHGLYASFCSRTKIFRILKFYNDFTYEELTSLTLEDDLIDTTAQTSAMGLFVNEDETKIVLRTRSKTGNYYYRPYSFSLTYGDTVTIEQIGSVVEFTTSSNQTAKAGAVKPDGTKFVSFQTNYKNAQVIDFINGTINNITFAEGESDVFSSDINYKVDENGLGVAVSSGSSKMAYKMQFDFVNDSVVYLGKVYLPSAKITNRSHDSYFCPFYIADKKIIVVLIGNNRTYSSANSTPQESYYKNPAEFIVVNAETGETVLQQVLKSSLIANPGKNYFTKISTASCFYKKLNNNRYLVGNAQVGVVEYDAEANQVFSCGTDDVLHEGDFVGQIADDGRVGFIQYSQVPIVSNDGSVLYGGSSGNQGYRDFVAQSTYYRAVIYPKVVWGELYKRNGNEIVRTSFFEPSLYEAGAYAEKDEVAIVDVES